MIVYDVEQYRTDSCFKDIRSIKLFANETGAQDFVDLYNAEEECDEFSTYRYRVVQRVVE